MTDLDRLKALFDEWGVEYTEPDYTGRFLGEPVYGDKKAVEVRATDDNAKVGGYGGFFASFYFNQDGAFHAMGIWELAVGTAIAILVVIGFYALVAIGKSAKKRPPAPPFRPPAPSRRVEPPPSVPPLTSMPAVRGVGPSGGYPFPSAAPAPAKAPDPGGIQLDPRFVWEYRASHPDLWVRVGCRHLNVLPVGDVAQLCVDCDRQFNIPAPPEEGK